MKCRDLQQQLFELLDARLDAATELRAHAHLQDCADCRSAADRWRAVTPSLRPLAPPPPTPFVQRRMLAEIERALTATPAAPARLPRRRAGLLVATAAVVAAAASLLLWMRSRPAPFGGHWTLEAGRSVDLEVPRLASLHLDGAASLTLTGDPDHVLMRLDDGTLTASVRHRAPGQTFAVATPDGRVEVRGTRFVVAAGRAGSWLRVEEGRVALFDRQGGEHDVAAGLTRDFAPDVRAPSLPSLPSGPPPAAAPAAAPAAKAQPSTDVCREPRLACRHASTAARAALRERRYGDMLDVVDSALAGHSPCARHLTACRDELGYLRAEALRLAGRIEEAVGAYRALDRAGATADMRQNALYAAAQLQLRLGDAVAARASYERALSVAPHGALREEAMLGAMHAAARSGDTAAARKLAREYLAAFPTGLAADEARRVDGGRAP